MFLQITTLHEKLDLPYTYRHRVWSISRAVSERERFQTQSFYKDETTQSAVIYIPFITMYTSTSW